jgi:hypothetical protein
MRRPFPLQVPQPSLLRVCADELTRSDAHNSLVYERRNYGHSAPPDWPMVHAPAARFWLTATPPCQTCLLFELSRGEPHVADLQSIQLEIIQHEAFRQAVVHSKCRYPGRFTRSVFNPTTCSAPLLFGRKPLSQRGLHHHQITKSAIVENDLQLRLIPRASQGPALVLGEVVVVGVGGHKV